MPLHKSIQPGDVVLKLRIPIAVYPLLKITRSTENFRFSDVFSDNENRYRYHHTSHSAIQQFARNVSHLERLINDKHSPKEANLIDMQIKNTRRHIHNNFVPSLSERVEEYVKDFSLLFNDIHPREHSGEYLHFMLIVNSRRARTRGERLPSFFEPFLKKLGVNCYYHQSHRFNYHQLHAHAFNMFNPSFVSNIKQKSIEEFQYHRIFSQMFAYPLRELTISKLDSFMPKAFDKPYIEAHADTFVAPGLSLHLVHPDIYEQLPVNEFAQQALTQMPDSFSNAIRYMQQSCYNLQADPNFLSIIFKSNISTSARNIYFDGSYYTIPDNLHLKEESVRRQALVNMSKYHIHENQHSVLFLHPLFNIMAYPNFMLSPIQIIPKKSLPAIELTFH